MANLYELWEEYYFKIKDVHGEETANQFKQEALKNIPTNAPSNDSWIKVLKRVASQWIKDTPDA